MKTVIALLIPLLFGCASNEKAGEWHTVKSDEIESRETVAAAPDDSGSRERSTDELITDSLRSGAGTQGERRLDRR